MPTTTARSAAALGLALLGTAAAVLPAYACSDHPQAPAGSVGAAHAGHAATTPNHVVTSDGKTVTGVPARLQAGYHQFAVRSTGTASLQFTVGRLAAGYTEAQLRKDLVASNGQDAAAIAAMKRIYTRYVSIGGATPEKGLTASKPVFTVNLAPGRYVAVGRFFGPPVPGAQTTPFTQAIVVTSGAVGRRPVPTTSIETFNFGFRVKGAAAGARTVAIRNTGNQTHFVEFYRYDAGHTRQQVLDALMAETPPTWISRAGFYGDVSPGQTMYGPLNLAPKTNYLLVCFVLDTAKATPMPHAMEGMYSFVTTR